VLHGRPDAAEEIENVKKSIRAAGDAGMPVVEYNFTPLRVSEGYASETGRGGIQLRNYDFESDRARSPALQCGRAHS
jgi:mannonate dehydratase